MLPELMTVEKSELFSLSWPMLLLMEEIWLTSIHLRWLFGISEPSTVGYLCLAKKVTGELQQGVDVALWWFMPGICCSGMLL